MTDKQIIIYKKECYNEPYCSFNQVLEQLKAKEQECDMWKNLTIDNGAVALKYQQQLDQLKAELEAEKNWHKTADEISKANSEYTTKLKQTLAEIKEIVQKSFESSQLTKLILDLILQKISECEVEK